MSHNQGAPRRPTGVFLPAMRDILISATVCVACLLLAFVSQLVSPTAPAAAAPAAQAAINSPATASAPAPAMAIGTATASRGTFELDPEDPNPTLFAMAPDQNPTIAQADALGGEMVAAKERITDSGLRITDLVIGDGPEARSGQTVVVHYRGTLENGTQFDASYDRGTPFSFPLGAGRVIKGWDEGVAGMQVGGKRKLVIPADLGYGARGAGGVIPPNATLIFEVELLEIRG